MTLKVALDEDYYENKGFSESVGVLWFSLVSADKGVATNIYYFSFQINVISNYIIFLFINFFQDKKARKKLLISILFVIIPLGIAFFLCGLKV